MSARRAGQAAALAVAALALGLAAAPGAVAAGAIDPSFGAGGSAATPLGVGARAAAVALVADGRITVAGDQRRSGAEGALTARFTQTGGLDRSFATTGARIDTFGGGDRPQRAGAVSVQADGSTIIAGVAGERWSLARYLPTGLTDGLFGAGGVTLRDPAPGGRPSEEFYPYEEPALPDGTGPMAISLAANGQIVVAGNVGVANDDGVPSEQIVVARFGPTGLPDPSFGRDGFALLQLGFGSGARHATSAARALTLLADGRIVIAGRASARDGGDRAMLARLTTAGRLDTAFARQGRLLVQLGRASAVRRASSSLAALAARPDGRLVAAGRATDVAGGHEALLAGFTAAGVPDASFGRRGSTVTQLGGGGAPARPVVSQARALALQPDGAAVVAGAATGSTLAARFDSNGALDCFYGRYGRTLTFGGARFDASTDGAFAAALQPDGRLLLAGRRAGGGLLLGRLDATPTVLPAVLPAPRLVVLGARHVGGGRGYAYGLVDRGCSAAGLRFTVTDRAGHTGRTKVQRVLGRSGPQVVCAPLTGLRQGRSYRVRLVSTDAGGPRSAQRILRALKPARRALPQEGCA